MGKILSNFKSSLLNNGFLSKMISKFKEDLSYQNFTFRLLNDRYVKYNIMKEEKLDLGVYFLDSLADIKLNLSSIYRVPNEILIRQKIYWLFFYRQDLVLEFFNALAFIPVNAKQIMTKFNKTGLTPSIRKEDYRGNSFRLKEIEEIPTEIFLVQHIEKDTNENILNRPELREPVLTSILLVKDFKHQTDRNILLMMFVNLRNAVMERYSDVVNYKQYEGQIQKLLDTHIHTDEIKPITELVNIFEKDKFHAEVEKTVGTAAKADKIATRTAKHITEKMDEDPAFYKKFSELLKETIADYETRRISEVEYLRKVQNIMESVVLHTDSSIPEALFKRDVAKAFFGLCVEALDEKIQDVVLKKEISTQAAIFIDDLIQDTVLDNGKPIIDWQFKSNITGKLQIDIGDYLIDEVNSKYHLDLSFGDLDVIAERCIDVAKVRYK
jgi:hypothetical protein